MITQSTNNILKTANWKMILYAKAGQGKTTSIRYLPGKTLVLDLDNSSKVLAGIAPNVALYKFDNGTKDGRPFNREQPIEDMNTFLSDSDLKEVSKNFNNLVIDNVSSFEKDWFVEMGRKSHNGISNEIQDYSQWTNYFARVVTTIYAIKGINVLITAWEQKIENELESGQTFSQYAPDVRTKSLNGFLGLADVVARLIVNPKTNNRGAVLEGNNTIYAKNRLDNRTLAPVEELFEFGKHEQSGKEKEGNE